MKKQKAIIFDIDGTAIDSPDQKLPTARLVDAARAIEGTHYLCAATGRVWSFAEPVLKGMALQDPCIISGGTQICNPSTGKIAWQCNIEPAGLQAVLAIVKQYPEYNVLYNDYVEHDYLYGGTSPRDISIHEPVYFFEQIFVPSGIAPEIVAKLSKIDGIACTPAIAQRPGFSDIHVTNRSATKEHAVGELLKLLHVKVGNTIGVGDGHNDLHLFSAVGHKVAMSNSVKDLKAAADEVIGSVNGDGFAAYLEKLASP